MGDYAMLGRQLATAPKANERSILVRIPANVSTYGAFALEFFVAHVALEHGVFGERPPATRRTRSISGMDRHVGGNGRFRFHGHAAVGAHERRPFAGVHQHVLGQIRFPLESGVALVAAELFVGGVDRKMKVQAVLVFEKFLADVALERFLPGMDDHVTF